MDATNQEGRFMDLKADLEQKVSQNFESTYFPFATGFKVFERPVRAALEDYLSKLSENRGDERLIVGNNRRGKGQTSTSNVEETENEAEKLYPAIKQHELEFLSENKEAEKLYSAKTQGEIESIISKETSQGDLMKLPIHYLSPVLLDTSVAYIFCVVLSSTFKDDKILFIDPLRWQRVQERGKQDTEFFSMVKKSNEVFIGVIADEHFYSIHVHMKDFKIFIVDSLISEGKRTYKDHITSLLELLLVHARIDKEKWQIFRVQDAPKQDNNVDCGVFMLKSMEYWAKGYKLPFTSEQAKAARHILMWEVINMKLVDSVSDLILD